MSHEAGILYIQLHLGQRNYSVQLLGDLPLIKKEFIIRVEIQHKAPDSTVPTHCLNKKIQILLYSLNKNQNYFASSAFDVPKY